jgi:DNA polymerase-3 subunit epsilon
LGSSNLDNITFVFVDVETTGLYVQFGERICEIALLKWRGGKDLATYHTLVNPERPISPGAAEVNHITDEEVKSAPTFHQIGDKVLEFIGDAVLVAHNAPFDMSFLETQLIISGFPPIENRIVDTLAIARMCYNFSGNALDRIALRYGLDTRNAHRALGDVMLTRQIFERFLNDLKRQGVATLSHLIDAQGGPVPPGVPEEAILPPNVQEMIANRTPLRMRYVNAEGEESERVIEVIQVSKLHDYVYLVAFCHKCQEQRTFRFDRILRIEAAK